MRHYDLQALSVETAGQSSAGALVKLVGVVDTEAFRAAVLAQRDKVVASLSGADSAPATAPNGPTAGSEAILTEIRDTLHRIEDRIGTTGP